MTTLAEKIAAKCADRLEYTGGDRKKIVAEILAALHEHAAPVEWAAEVSARGLIVERAAALCSVTLRMHLKSVEAVGPTVADACQQARERAEGKQ